MALITGTPVGTNTPKRTYIWRRTYYLHPAIRSTAMVFSDSDGFYWGLTGTVTYHTMRSVVWPMYLWPRTWQWMTFFVTISVWKILFSNATILSSRLPSIILALSGPEAFAQVWNDHSYCSNWKDADWKDQQRVEIHVWALRSRWRCRWLHRPDASQMQICGCLDDQHAVWYSVASHGI